LTSSIDDFSGQLHALIILPHSLYHWIRSRVFPNGGDIGNKPDPTRNLTPVIGALSESPYRHMYYNSNTEILSFLYIRK
jgi:hypothetical protein